MAELTNGLAFLGLEMTDEQIHIFHAACDFDGDGSISLEECTLKILRYVTLCVVCSV